MEHIGRFMALSDEELELVSQATIFFSPFGGVAFTWYSNLPLNPVQNLANLERFFHD